MRVVFHPLYFLKFFQKLAHSAGPEGEAVFSKAPSLSYRRFVCTLGGGGGRVEVVVVVRGVGVHGPSLAPSQRQSTGAESSLNAVLKDSQRVNKTLYSCVFFVFLGGKKAYKKFR